MKGDFPGGPLYKGPVFSSIPDMLVRAARRAPDKTFVTEPTPNDTWRSITYGEMHTILHYSGSNIFFFDGDGFLFITGRKKNVIVAKNGKNVYPEEIETIINRSDLLSESMVFGMESESKGEEIWAILVPDLDCFIERAEALGESLEPGQVLEAMRVLVRDYHASQPPYKRIRSFMVREEPPKTTTRKIRRREVMGEAGLEREPVYSPSRGRRRFAYLPIDYQVSRKYTSMGAAKWPKSCEGAPDASFPRPTPTLTSTRTESAGYAGSSTAGTRT